MTEMKNKVFISTELSMRKSVILLSFYVIIPKKYTICE